MIGALGMPGKSFGVKIHQFSASPQGLATKEAFRMTANNANKPLSRFFKPHQHQVPLP
jgi:hypothetical protein